MRLYIVYCSNESQLLPKRLWQFIDSTGGSIMQIFVISALHVTPCTSECAIHIAFGAANVTQFEAYVERLLREVILNCHAGKKSELGNTSIMYADSPVLQE